MTILDSWEDAQLKADSPEAWHEADRLAIDAARQGFSDIEEVKIAIRLALTRYGGSVDALLEPGDPADIWIKHLLQAVLQAFDNGLCIQQKFVDLPTGSPLDR